MGKERRERVSAERVQLVFDRMQQARLELKWSLKRAAQELTEARRAMWRERKGAGETPPRGYGRALDHTQVKRLEGKTRDGRRTAPAKEVVQAAARAYGQPEKWLLGEEDRPPEPGSQASLDELGRDASEYAPRWIQRPASPETERYLAIRGAVQRVLAASFGFVNEHGQVPDRISIPAIEVLTQVEALFWEAFDNRGLTDSGLLEAARHFGLVLITPARLPAAGFWTVTLAGIDEVSFREFWQLQLAAVRRLVLPQPALSPEQASRRNRIQQELATRRGQSFVPWARHLDEWARHSREQGDPGRLDFQYSRLDHDFAIWLNEIVAREADALGEHMWSGDRHPEGGGETPNPQRAP